MHSQRCMPSFMNLRKRGIQPVSRKLPCYTTNREVSTKYLPKINLSPCLRAPTRIGLNVVVRGAAEWCLLSGSYKHADITALTKRTHPLPVAFFSLDLSQNGLNISACLFE